MTNVHSLKPLVICATCKWFVDKDKDKNPRVDGKVELRSGASGICKRYPPKNEKQETVSYFDECGEFTE